MADDSIHKPKLPGVRTLQEEAGTYDEAELGISFASASKAPLTKPEPTITVGGNSHGNHDKHLFDVGRAIDDNQLEVGTFVTDKRRKRFDVGAIAESALREWWSKATKTIKKIEAFAAPEETEKITVKKAEVRKEVIAQASELSKLAPRDDHKVVVEKIKTLGHDAERLTGNAYQIKAPKPYSNATPTWKTAVEPTPKATPVTAPKSTYSGATPEVTITLPKKSTKPITTEVKKTPAEPEQSDIRTMQRDSDDARGLEHKVPEISKTITQFTQATPNRGAGLWKLFKPPTHKQKSTVTVAPPVPKPISRVQIPASEPVVRIERVDAPTPEKITPPAVAPARQPEPAPIKELPEESDPKVHKKADEAPKVIEPVVEISPTAEPAKPKEIETTPNVPHSKPPEEPVPVEPTAVVVPEEKNTHEAAPAAPTPKPKVKAPKTRLVLSEKPYFEFIDEEKPSPTTVTTGPIAEPQVKAAKAPARWTTNRLSFLAILALVVIVGATAGIYAGLRYSAQEALDLFDERTVEVQSLFQTDRAVAVTMSGSAEEIAASIRSEITAAPSGITHIYGVTVDEKGRQVAVTSESFIKSLGWRIESRFLRILDPVMMIGSIYTETNEPFIVLRSSNFDVAFPSMLVWESVLRDDIAPVFGLTKQAAAKPFTDALSNNQTVRVLTNENGEEEIVYAFVDRKTIIITSSTAALAALIDGL